MEKFCNSLFAVFVAMLMSLSQPVLGAMDLKQIQTLLTEGKLDQALSETDALLVQDKNNLQALFIKGLIYTKMNQLDKAEQIFLELNKNNPDLPEPYNNLAVIYASQGEYEKAREALQNAINTHPSYATAHENIGDIYAKMASQAYNQALELDNSNVAAREKLSLINELFSVPASAVKPEVKTTGIIETKPAAPDTIAAAPAPAPVKTEPEIKPAPAPEVKPEPEVIPEPETRPAPEVQPPPEVKPAQDNQIILTISNNVNNWAKAWSSQDLNAYLSWYAPDYTPSADVSRDAWVAQRNKRLSQPGFIKVDISNLNVIMHGDEHAQATFLQNYQSDTYSDSVPKTLLFRNLNNRWLIVQEKSE